MMALGVIARLRQQQRVPQDVSVVGFGDGPEARAAKLTTVAADVEELGRRAAKQVVHQMKGGKISGVTTLSVRLIERNTSYDDPPDPWNMREKREPRIAVCGSAGVGKLTSPQAPLRKEERRKHPPPRPSFRCSWRTVLVIDPRPTLERVAGERRAPYPQPLSSGRGQALDLPEGLASGAQKTTPIVKSVRPSRQRRGEARVKVAVRPKWSEG